MALSLILDGSKITSEQDFHDSVAHASGIDFYGRNLDALRDLLTGLVDPPISIIWTKAGASRDAIGPRFDQIVGVLRDAETELGPARLNFRIEL